MNITATCKYDLKAYQALTRLSMFKKSNPKKQFIFLFALETLLFLIMIWESFWVEGIMLLSIISYFLMTFLLFFGYFILPKIQYKASYKMADIEAEFTFTDTQLRISTKGASYEGTAQLDYSVLFKVMETGTYLFLFERKSVAYIVEKATLTGGTIEELRTALSSVLGKNYIICNY